MWIKYNTQTRQQIATANAIAVRYNNGSTKTVTEKDSMLHLVKYNCSCLIAEFRIL